VQALPRIAVSSASSEVSAVESKIRSLRAELEALTSRLDGLASGGERIELNRCDEGIGSRTDGTPLDH
jgi:hypothetical protein